MQGSPENFFEANQHSTNFLLARKLPGEFYLAQILSVKTNGIHASFLFAALGVVTLQNLLYADERSVVETRSTGIVSEGISSNPGAVDIRTGTGELAETLKKLAGLPQESGVFLGGVWVDTIPKDCSTATSARREISRKIVEPRGLRSR